MVSEGSLIALLGYQKDRGATRNGSTLNPSLEYIVDMNAMRPLGHISQVDRLSVQHRAGIT